MNDNTERVLRETLAEAAEQAPPFDPRSPEAHAAVRQHAFEQLREGLPADVPDEAIEHLLDEAVRRGREAAPGGIVRIHVVEERRSWLARHPITANVVNFLIALNSLRMVVQYRSCETLRDRFLVLVGMGTLLLLGRLYLLKIELWNQEREGR